MEIDAILDDMPDAPSQPPRRGIGSEMNIENIVRSGVAFALFVVSILLVVWAVGLLEKGLLDPYPPELAQRHEEFKQLSGFDNVTTSGYGVDVCIVDTGIDLSHPDLAHLELAGWKDFISNRGEPYDDQGHGTSMAGILVADGGMKGVAPEVELVVAKALSGNGTGDDGIVADAIDWCVDQGSHIISLSLGGAPGLLPFNPFGGRDSSDAADDAIDQGIVVIAAAGNDGGPDDDGDVAHPSSERLVISVGGHTEDGIHWSGSSTGDNNGNLLPLILPRQDPHKKPEVVAPAEGVPVVNNDGTWSIVDGTSAATVFVTGAIALLLEAQPSLAGNETSGSSASVIQIKQALMDTAKPQPGQDGHDDDYGYGMLQIENLINSFAQE